MEILQYLLLCAVILFIILSTLRMFYSFVILILSLFGISPAQKKLKFLYKPFLVKHFEFYNKLNTYDKEIFEKRVQLFIDLKTFIPRNGITTITPEMKVIIAGSAIQITFGYPKVYFRYFRKILVFPDKYYNRITKQYHKGEVNGRGIIVLSMDSLMKGYANPSDGINLGLHEMAHAMHLENMVKNNEFNFLDRKAMAKLMTEADIEIIKIKEGINKLYRQYGSTNFPEFFAVSIELFFEKTNELFQYNKKLYSLLTKVLNHDPRTYK